jgi:membrane-bound serine protease (ClpP class)
MRYVLGGLALLLLTLALFPAPLRAANGMETVLWVEVEDVIGPISSRYVIDAIAQGEKSGAAAVVLELDTPGGLDTAMRQIIKAILASEVPVCVYVAPEGARAASAGVYISYSAHVAAMAPGTNLGAATPVNLGGGEMDSTMSHKVINDAAAYIQSLARRRGRNEEWAVKAVHEAVSLPAEEAVEEHVVDFLATGPRDLLEKMDGRIVSVAADSAHVIRTAEAEIEEFSLSFRYRVLSALNNPNVAYLLLLLGFYGLFFELSNPGVILPGVLGGICLILGLFALQSLSLNYAGLLLIIFGVVLFFLETQITSHGILGLGGTASLLAGSLLLIDSPVPYLRVSLKVIVPAVAVTALFFLFAASMAVRAQRRKVVSGREGMVGARGVARTALDPHGSVFVSGEHWTATSATGEEIPAGTDVEVVSVDRLSITVRPARPR